METRRRHAVTGAWISALVLLATPAAAPAAPPGPPPVLGLVEIPALFGGGPEPAPLPEAGIPARREPAPDAERVAGLDSADDVASREHGYEERSALVYGHTYADGLTWYQLRLREPEAPVWVSSEYASRFHPVSELLEHSLGYLTGAWDRKLYRTAGDASSVATLDVSGDEVPATVASSARVGDVTWLLVVVLSESPCGASEAPAIRAAGWVPAHAASGAMNLWFYSRGC